MLTVLTPHVMVLCRPGTRPTNDIWIEFEIQQNFTMLLFITYSVDRNKILHSSQQ